MMNKKRLRVGSIPPQQEQLSAYREKLLSITTEA